MNTSVVVTSLDLADAIDTGVQCLALISDSALVHVANGCGDVAMRSMMKSHTISLEILQQDQATVFFSLNFPAEVRSQTCEAFLLDELGRTVKRLSIPAGSGGVHSLSVAPLGSGIYTLGVKIGKELAFRRFAVIR